MLKHKLFSRSRWRLALWYTGVMGLIMGVCGLAVYEMIATNHWKALDRELDSLAGTLHDSVEPMLKQPGRLEASVQQILPGLRLTDSSCSELSGAKRSYIHLLGTLNQEGYYVRFLDRKGRLVGTVGCQPPGLPFRVETGFRQPLQDREGHRYHQISILLKINHNLPWGYIQVGRSLKQLEEYLEKLRLFSLLGLPIGLLLISGASWWLAGLAMQPVYQSYQQIQQFTADAAHELRTPLATIRATVESALEIDDLSKLEARNMLQIIERQNGRLAQLVQELLLLSRMDLQRVLLEPQPCCLNDLIGDLLEGFSALALAADILLSAEFLVPDSVYVLGDEEQLYRLVANLVINAIQYTPRGGKVILHLDRNNHHALIQVQDTGPGIAPQEQARIFERFYRVSSDRSRKTGGSGLGLAIAMAIVQAHHGSLQVQSELGQGSTFTIRLPLERIPPLSGCSSQHVIPE